ncbi:hypothetical protein [Deinococcus planocerae]|uniref:hypothetical protein n=1 Tax=Deinococcus planocerae TaxID=1737569 RepID=UPI0011AEF01F|nr:hypothetical protein [Deinococcus planocerae]
MTTASLIQVDRRALLTFMDEVPEDERGHHTAISSFLGEPLAVALILHFLTGQGGRAECLSLKVTTGQKKGPRLDAWIRDGQRSLYQTEVKMWAGNAIGGLRLPLEASTEQALAVGNEQWERIWDDQQHTFKDQKKVRKVLVPMRQPKGFEGARVEALACFWWMVQPKGGSGPWFTVSTSHQEFPQVHIFSLSAYLRSLEEDMLALPMPLVTTRLSLLRKLLPTN